MSSYFGEMPDYLKNISLGDCMYKAYIFCREKFGDTFADSDSGRLFVHNVGVKDYQFLLKLKKEQEEMEKSKPIEGFDIAYSDEELQTAQELFEGAKRLNKAINDAMHGKIINSNKEQEKMKKYEINLQEVAEDLREYLNDYNIYTEVNKDNSDVCVRLHNYDAPYVVILHWNDEADIKWTERWEVQPVSAKYYINRGFMTVYDLGCLIQDIDRFLSDWYGDNKELDIKRDLPQTVINELKIAFNDNRNEINACFYDNSLAVSIMNPNNLATIEANYVIKERSAFLTSCHAGGAFLTKEAEVSTIVRKCVMEWDK